MKIKILLLLLFANANVILAQDFYLGEIKLFPLSFNPTGWVSCNGQILPINQNQALYAILGTTYGGNGVNTFALPDLRGRVVVGKSATNVLGQRTGQEFVPLTNNNTSHSHTAAIKVNSSVASVQSPSTGNAIGAAQMNVNGTDIPVLGFNSLVPNILLAQDATSIVGSSQPINVMQPIIALRYMIAIQGVFPFEN